MLRSRIYVVIPMGGLGNQLFQLAFYRWLRAQGARAFLLLCSDEIKAGRLTRACQLNLFCSNDATLTGKLGYSLHRAGYSRFRCLLSGGRLSLIDLCQAENLSAVESSIASAGSLAIHLVVGYFQYADLLAQEDVWDKAQIRAVLSNHSEEWPLKLTPDFDKDCIIHVRRGDYVRMGFQVLSNNYYAAALSNLQTQGFSGRVFVMTDEPNHLSELPFPVQTHFVDIENPLPAMELFGRFRYQVIANSTFSLWGSLLGREDSIVVYPTRWTYFEAELTRVCSSRGWLRNEAL